MRRKDFCMRPEMWGPQLRSWDLLEHGTTGRPRFEYNYSDPSHPDSKSLIARCFPQKSSRHVKRSSGCRKMAWLQVAAQVAFVIWNEASSTQTSAALVSAMMQVKTTDAGTAFCILMVHFAGLNWVGMAEAQSTRLASTRLSWLCQVHSPFLTASVLHKRY